MNFKPHFLAKGVFLSKGVLKSMTASLLSFDLFPFSLETLASGRRRYVSNRLSGDSKRHEHEERVTRMPPRTFKANESRNFWTHEHDPFEPGRPLKDFLFYRMKNLLGSFPRTCAAIAPLVL